MDTQWYVFKSHGEIEYVIQDGLTYDQAMGLIVRAAKNLSITNGIELDQAMELTGLYINSHF
jgi:hypothetical protein